MFIAIFIIIPSILLSGFIFPLEAIPAMVRPISYAIPITYIVEIIRGLLIKQTLLGSASRICTLTGFCSVVRYYKYLEI